MPITSNVLKKNCDSKTSDLEKSTLNYVLTYTDEFGFNKLLGKLSFYHIVYQDVCAKKESWKCEKLLMPGSSVHYLDVH